MSAASSDSEEDDCLATAGQQEPLTRRLKNVIRDYPVESIAKESLQNAEDADATLFRVVLDHRVFGVKELMAPEMAVWQGSEESPVLWFQNDSLFKREDWKGIQSLSQGGKRDEKNGSSQKIGRHGLGFNAIYNLTDVPCILSGSTIMYFDPHAKYLPPPASRAEPGIGIDISKKSFQKNKRNEWRDQLAPFQALMSCGFDAGRYEGTLFRAPLRGPEVQSEIKDTWQPGTQLGHNILQNFLDSSELYLIFLTKVRQLHADTIMTDGSVRPFMRKRVTSSRLPDRTAGGTTVSVEELRIFTDKPGQQAEAVYDVVHYNADTSVAASRALAVETESDAGELP